ncbi:MAG: triose-phosphate isomerase [Ignavibacteriae bacterium HGW-Ignavibacteriae-4]|jgi:triosephosphate isomerase|nr:MAG: triose-phosphate isomerase [Ignavibacteriae bacterium HGW-Ignavibacteriae-4]
MSKYLIAGNWKMNTNLDEAKIITDGLHSFINYDSEVEMLICPPYTHLGFLSEIVDLSRISLGAQNVHYEESGAFTGEISNDMLLSVGCEYVIIGHSERRTLFCETDVNINKKVVNSLKAGLRVILCIGETLEERESGLTNSVLKEQLNIGLAGVVDTINLKIAYEPIWAIGTGRTASTDQITETHGFIAEFLKNRFGANTIKILYGGSMNSDNAKEILSILNVNGGLIGGASLKSESFLAIYNSALELC